MKREWFEPGPDGVSPFVRKYKVSPGGVEDAIAAAFRALLADDQATPVVHVDLAIQPDAARAEVERLQGELLQCNHMNRDLTVEVDPHGDRWVLLGEWNKSAAERDAARAEVERLTAQLLQVESFIRENDAPPARISKLINQRQELAILNSKYIEAKHQRDALQASLRDEQSKRASIEAELAACRESRDALQALVDAGTVVFRHGQSAWWPGQSGADTHTALLIDIQPIATEMVDERKTPGTRAYRRAS